MRSDFLILRDFGKAVAPLKLKTLDKRNEEHNVSKFFKQVNKHQKLLVDNGWEPELAISALRNVYEDLPYVE